MAAMPLVRRYSDPDPILAGWALIFRDHYVENSVGLVLGLENAGIESKWICTLAKGDRTRGRERVHATFLARGYSSGVLDNAAIDAPGAHQSVLATAVNKLDQFITSAHDAGKRVLVIDDGGLIVCGYGERGDRPTVDAAIELTVSGLKRLQSIGPLNIPIINMARSTVKTLLGYPEIADSCIRRLRELLPTQKLIGRPVMVVGYGSLGSRLARMLRALGARVSVVDSDILALIYAAEDGFYTTPSLEEAIQADSPFLIVGATGESLFSKADVNLLPDGVYLAPFATRDFSLLFDPSLGMQAIPESGIGVQFRFSSGKSVVLLGDGRSMNLFEADSIPNQGYDGYRAGTIVAAKALCSADSSKTIDISSDFGDQAILRSGLFEAYYELYLAPKRANGPNRSAT